MTIELSSEAMRLIEEFMRGGGYASPEEVVLAALGALERDADYGDFAPGELNALIAEGEKSLLEHGPIDHEVVMERLRKRFGPKE